jgi:outer membrane lipoprotein SlyB
VKFNFESITLRSGERYDFAGYLQSIKDQNGKPVRVDSEGVAKGDSQTRETAKRGGIGAGLGAVIGAIAGGGKGAAIGAIIGGGAGAGSVIAQGRDDVQLFKGSMITVQSSSPIRRDQPQFDN